MSSQAWPWQDSSQVQIKCFGCKREFPSMEAYKSHRCPNPASGEAYR
jgi:predicted RNA-binding Zn-ribbon protein involved in translation (DUF1610 family)